ncbi:hypothetical protein V9T40_012674 [Parthenolecanium corni]|uniref:Platelet-derived growth factor (PDGF) family profile domain-containing protein n=1 Tax=Parthenolecanium corni TaxID=536013 RepID=A0AAN9T7N6_9HEMI
MFSTFLQRPKADHQRTPKSIPIDLARKLNSIENMDQFFVEFVDVEGHSSLASPPEGNPGGARLLDRQQNGGKDAVIEPQLSMAQIPQLQTRSTQRQGSPVLIPKFAGCNPEQRTVNLRDTDDPTLFYYPSCTRVDRCGGCCSHELLTCQPKTKQYINYTVHVSKYIGKSKLEYRGTKVVTVEKHLKCNCECKVKPTDCTSQQKYEENDCRCVCTNKEEEQRCTQEEKTKLWNPSTCQCQCREVHECSSGFFFDETRCS